MGSAQTRNFFDKKLSKTLINAKLFFCEMMFFLTFFIILTPKLCKYAYFGYFNIRKMSGFQLIIMAQKAPIDGAKNTSFLTFLCFMTLMGSAQTRNFFDKKLSKTLINAKLFFCEMMFFLTFFIILTPKLRKYAYFSYFNIRKMSGFQLIIMAQKAPIDGAKNTSFLTFLCFMTLMGSAQTRNFFDKKLSKTLINAKLFFCEMMFFLTFFIILTPKLRKYAYFSYFNIRKMSGFQLIIMAQKAPIDGAKNTSFLTFLCFMTLMGSAQTRNFFDKKLSKTLINAKLFFCEMMFFLTFFIILTPKLRKYAYFSYFNIRKMSGFQLIIMAQKAPIDGAKNTSFLTFLCFMTHMGSAQTRNFFDKKLSKTLINAQLFF